MGDFDIAVIDVACRVPGAPDIARFWENPPTRAKRSSPLPYLRARGHRPGGLPVEPSTSRPRRPARFDRRTAARVTPIARQTKGELHG
jgi:hypothetical protein